VRERMTKKTSCQECVEEMSLFCKDCPHINTNITRGFRTIKYLDAEDWIHAQYASVKNCNDYGNLNRLQDGAIAAIRRFETEVERWK